MKKTLIGIAMGALMTTAALAEEGKNTEVSIDLPEGKTATTQVRLDDKAIAKLESSIHEGIMNPKKDRTKVGYIKVLAGTLMHKDAKGIAPGLSIGRTVMVDNTGVDFSLNFIGNENQAYWSFPRVMWKQFFEPSETGGFFIGAGASLGGTYYRTNFHEVTGTNWNGDPYSYSTHDRHETFGAMLDGTIGYQFNFHEKMKGLVDLTIAAPMIPQLDAPVIFVGFGIAY